MKDLKLRTRTYGMKGISIVILILLLSCGQGGKKPNETKDSTSITSIDTVSRAAVCGYDNQVSSLGIGLVIAPDIFTLFNDSLLTDQFARQEIYTESESNPSICSKFWLPEYGIMHFVCVGMTDKAFRVLVDYSNTKYFPKEKGYVFKTWDEYIMQSMGVRRVTDQLGTSPASLPLRTEPSDSASILTIPPGLEMFCQMETRGDWVRVTYDCFYNDPDDPYEGEPCFNYIDKCTDPLIGWLRWRKENQLLIDIFLLP